MHIYIYEATERETQIHGSGVTESLREPSSPKTPTWTLLAPTVDDRNLAALYMGARQNRWYVTRPGVLSRYRTRYIRCIYIYAYHGAFCDLLPALVPENCRKKLGTLEQELLILEILRVVEPPRDIPCYIPVTHLHLCFALRRPLQGTMTTGIDTVSLYVGFATKV